MKNRNQLALSGLLGVLAGASLPANAGGLERLCLGGVAPPVVERWNSIPPTGLKFTLLYKGTPGTPFSTWDAAPGFPNPTPGGYIPVEQSFAAAAATWSGVTNSGGSVLSDFAIDPVLDRVVVANPESTGLTTNYINMWLRFAGPFGTALAIADVDQAGGSISRAAIFINVEDNFNSTAQPVWSVLETDPVGPTTYATGQMPAFFPPAQAFADLEGVLTHELGHAAGLSHSLIDAAGGTIPDDNKTPTMAPDAVGRVVPSLTFTSSGISMTLTDPPVLAEAARTLEADDVSAIAEGYPSAMLPTAAGRIQGQVLDSTGSLVNGLHVIAIKTDAINDVRVGTYTYPLGTTGPNPVHFSLEALEDGDYYVYIESFDNLYHQLPANQQPEFLLTSGNGCFTSANPARVVPSEFYNSPDGPAEPSELATPITVVAGSAPYITLVLNEAQSSPPTAGTVDLDVRITGGTYSNKGVLFRNVYSTQTLDLRVDAGVVSAGMPYVIKGAFGRQTTLLPVSGGNGVFQPESATLFDAAPSGSLNGSGRATIQLTIPAGVGVEGQNLMFQAVIPDNNVVHLSNTVNVHLVQP